VGKLFIHSVQKNTTPNAASKFNKKHANRTGFPAQTTTSHDKNKKTAVPHPKKNQTAPRSLPNNHHTQQKQTERRSKKKHTQTAPCPPPAEHHQLTSQTNTTPLPRSKKAKTNRTPLPRSINTTFDHKQNHRAPLLVRKKTHPAPCGTTTTHNNPQYRPFLGGTR